MTKPSGEKIADYAWLKKGRKYWNVWIGNPFMVQVFRYDIDLPKHLLVEHVEHHQSREKARFAKQFPDVEWEG